MSLPLPNPDDWMDVVDHVLIGVFMLLIAAIPTWLTVRGNKGIKDIKDQVVNGHKNSPPLRADIDKAIYAIESVRSDLAHFRDSITAEVANLRRHLTDEETVRREHIAEVRADTERRISDLHNRLKGKSE